MNNREFKKRINEACTLISQGKYQEAVETCDDLDLELLKEPRKLQSIAKAYEKCRRYIDAEDLLLQAHDAAPRSRSILFHLCNVTTKAGEYQQAHTYVEQYEKLASGDSQLYIVQYRLATAENKPLRDRIRILEKYVAEEKDDRWMFTLAELYEKAERIEDAISLCDEIELWYNSGKYLREAQELRQRLGGTAPDYSEAMSRFGEAVRAEFAEEDGEPAETEEPEESSVSSSEEEPEESTEPEVTESAPEPVEETISGPAFDPAVFEDEEPEEQKTEVFASKYSVPRPTGYVVPTGKYEERMEAKKVSAAEDSDASEEPVEPIQVDFIEEMSLSGTESVSQAETDAEDIEEPAGSGPLHIEREPEDVSEEIQEATTPVERVESEMTGDSEGARALQERTEQSMSPDEWNHIVFSDDDDDEAEEEPLISEEEAAFGEAALNEAEIPEAEASAPVQEIEETGEGIIEESIEIPEIAEDEEAEAPEEFDVLIEEETAEPEESIEELLDEDLEIVEETETAETVEISEPEAESAEAEDVVEEVDDAVEDVEAAEETADETAEEADAAEEEHVVISVTGEPEPAPEEAAETPEVSEEEPELPKEIGFNWAETPAPEPVKPAASDTKVESGTGAIPAPVDVNTAAFQIEFDFSDIETGPKEHSEKKDMLDLLFDEEGGTQAVQKELQKRKSIKALFGNIPIEPEIENVWHFIVYAENRTLSMECAREEIKALGAATASCPKKMLKINAGKIGNASIINSLDRFLGNIVIVEDANLLSDLQLRDFTKILDKDDRSLLVVFSDTRENVVEMLEREPGLGECFTGVFQGKRYTPDDLVKAAKDYLFMEAAKLSKDGEAAVYEEGRRLIADANGFYRSDIVEFASEGLQVAEKGGFLGLFGGKCDKDGYLIVTGKHFRKAMKKKKK